MSAVDELRQHALELARATGLEVEVTVDGARICAVIKKMPLPVGFANIESSDVLVLADHQYSLSSMDMFYTEASVLKPDGKPHQSAEQIERYLGRDWRRFSWHRNGIWNPHGNPLLDHFAFIESRLKEKV